MPVYEYYCEPCDVKFDKMRPMSQRNEPIECPDCGASTGERQVEMFGFKYEGHYYMGSAKERHTEYHD
jgi:putative FmdB family regulatory protein